MSIQKKRPPMFVNPQNRMIMLPAIEQDQMQAENKSQIDKNKRGLINAK